MASQTGTMAPCRCAAAPMPALVLLLAMVAPTACRGMVHGWGPPQRDHPGMGALLVDAAPEAADVTPVGLYISHHRPVQLNPKMQEPNATDDKTMKQKGEAQGRPMQTPVEIFAQILPIIAVVGLALSKARQLLNAASRPDLRWVIEFLCALTLFLVSGPAVILLNKHIMKAQHFQFPVLLASLGSALNMVLTRVAVYSGLVKLQTPVLEWRRYFRVVVPVNIFNFSTQVLGMAAYMFISVPLIQILKSVTVVFTMIFAAIIIREPVNGLLCLSVVIVSAGTFVSAAFEPHGSAPGAMDGEHLGVGVTLCLLAGACEAAKSVTSQILMDNLSVFDGLYWSSPTFVLIACIVVPSMEIRGLLQFHFTGQVVWLLVGNALLTSVVVFASFWFVKLVGALSLKIVTQGRTVALILCSVFIFNETCLAMQYVGYAITIVGMALFDRSKQQLAEAKRKALQHEEDAKLGMKA